jgi:hypothetical protein
MKNIFHKGPFIVGGTQKESCPKIIVKALFEQSLHLQNSLFNRFFSLNTHILLD